MSARETLNRWVEAMQILCGRDDNPGPERRAGYEETRRKMIDAAYAEVLAEGARLLEDAACDADWDRTPDYCAGLRAGAELLLANTGKKATTTATATPDFFQPSHTYTREHHGDTTRFLVRGVSWAPDHSYRVAFGWRVDDDGDWEFTDSDDMDGWVDVTEAGDR